jgi:diguanylate cyclase (GGDEF)-like protein/PAS domain S-box-containing protein
MNMRGENVIERASWLLESSGDAGIITALDGTIEYVNPAFEALTGYARRQALGRTPAILKSGLQSDQFYRELWSTLRAGREFRGVLVNRRRDGAIFHEEKTIRPLFEPDGSVRHYMASGRDVSLRIAALDKLRYDSTHDGLTDLPNRTLYLDRLEQALAHAARSGERLAVALIDLNGFKGINDSHGHDTGDAALRATAQRLKRCLRQSDTAARLGGDEFALLLHDAGDVERVLGAVMQACGEPLGREGGERIPLSVSAGVACYPEDGQTATALLRRADEAMYCAKRNGDHRSRWAMAQAPADAPPVTPRCEGMPSGLDLLERELPVLRRVLKAGDTLYRAGDKFRDIHVLRVGLCKLSGYCAEGREDLITILFKGDWLGFDGLADGRHRYTAVAADVCEVLTVSYEALLRAGARNPALLAQMHSAISRQNARERDAVLSMHALPADGRVAAFLCRWADELEQCGLRSDQITLPTTRAEIGGHVGLRLESVSRAMSNLAREELIRFGARSRRDIEIPNLMALRSYVNRLTEAAR